MITEKDLQEAIAECQGKRNPDANTCIKLAAFLTIQREMFGTADETNILSAPAYSYSPGPVENTIEYHSDTEFSRMISGRAPKEVWPVVDELMTTLEAVYPRLYDSVIRELS